MCREWGIDHTFAPVGRPTGNAVTERFIRTLKEELIWLQDWDSLEELQAALDEYRRHYNGVRPHQALAYQTPDEFRTSKLGDRKEAVAA
ncbi:IS2 transposase TnpB [compost metagenome]